MRYDYRELVPLLRHRYEPDAPEVRRVLDRPRDVRMSMDARLQLRIGRSSSRSSARPVATKVHSWCSTRANGDLLASVNYPLIADGQEDGHLDRARYGLYPPGSTFKVVTAMAALRKDAALTGQKYSCVRLPDGRAETISKGSGGPSAMTCSMPRRMGP